MTETDLAHEEAPELASLWWLFPVLGVLSCVAGVILVARPSNSLKTLAVVVGIFLLLDGIFQLASSLGRGADNRALAAILGVLGIVVGIALIRHPFHGVSAVGILLGIWLVASGLIRLVRAIVVPLHRLLGIVIALLETVVGIVIVSDPRIGYTTLAVLAGIWLIVNGIATIVFGFAIRAAGAGSPSRT